MAKLWRGWKAADDVAEPPHPEHFHTPSPALWSRPTVDDSYLTGSTQRPMSEVHGPTVIPTITVGTPSALGEPSAIGTEFRPLPFRPDTVIDGWSAHGISIRGASLRGHLHRFNGAPREDDFAVHRLPGGRVVILVADGVSEARQSHIGAAVAVRSAAEWMHSSLAQDVTETDWQHCFASVAWALNEQAQRLHGLQEPDPVQTEKYLSTTLVCAVVESTGFGKLRAHVVGVGDSSGWLLSRGFFTDLLHSAPPSASGIASSEVTGLPRVPSGLVPVIVDVQPGEALLLGTDGFGDPLGNGEGGIGNLFRDVLSRPTPPSLIEFAHALDFSREAFDDDRTLVAAWPTPDHDTYDSRDSVSRNTFGGPR